MTAPARADERADLDPDWRERAACRDAADADSAFFPPRGHIAHQVARVTAWRYCATCPVLAECAAFAEATGAQGVWGGTYRTGSGRKVSVRPLLGGGR